ncbi:MAG: hypothetical protein WC804_06985 [Sphingomonas sp.]|jgi:hypothetical protein|uniref:hypothetical protein n=1 Tax=Sphingomonas sp. TaxID=28214 RepID=UPI003569904D
MAATDSADIVSIWVPCEPFEVTLSADNDGPTSIEKAVLLLLSHRTDQTLQDVLDFLGLGERLTMDLITELWRRGYILVDTVTDRIQIEPSWRSLVTHGEWSKIKTAHTRSETVSLMRELVSGQIVGDRSSDAAPAPGAGAPMLVSATLQEVVGNRDVALAALNHLNPNSPLRSRSRNLTAKLLSADRSVQSRRLGWLRLDFEATLDSDSANSLTIHSLSRGDSALARLGPGIARALTDWAVENTDEPLVRNLAKKAKRRSARPSPSLASRVHALLERIEATLAAPVAQQNQLEAWVESLMAIEADIEAVREAGGVTNLHCGEAAHTWFRDVAIQGFEHQLAIMVPTLDFAGLSACNDAIVSRLASAPVDASMFLLWGGGRLQQLPPACHNLLGNMASESRSAEGPRLRFADRSSRIASTMAVADGQRIFYASASPLDSRSATGGFAFVLDVMSGPHSAMARRLLEIARNRSPDYDMAETINLHAWHRHQAGDRRIPNLRTSSEENGDEEGLDDGYPADNSLITTARLYDLKVRCTEAARRLQSGRMTAEVITDAGLFQRALDIVADTEKISAEPSLWLGLGADLASGRSLPLHRALTDAITARVKGRLETVLLIEQFNGRHGVEIGAVQALAEASPELVTIIPVNGLPGNFVCGEERFLVSPGGLASPVEPESRRLSSRLIGVGISDSVLCAKFRHALADWEPRLRARLGTDKLNPSAQPKTDLPERVPMPSIAEIAAAWQSAKPAQRISALTGALCGQDGIEAGTIEALLNMSSGGPKADPMLSEFRADVLQIAALHAGEPLASQALDALIEMAWSRGEWQQAALMLEAARPNGTLVAADFAVANAEADSGLTLSGMPDALESHGDDAWLGSVALGIKAVLFNGDAAMADALEVKLAVDSPPQLAGSLGTIAAAVLAYWHATGGQVDKETIQAIASQQDAEKRIPTLARLFAETYRLAAKPTFQKRFLRRVTANLYAVTSRLRPIAEAIPDDGPERVPKAVWKKIETDLIAIFGRGPVDVRRASEEMFGLACKQHMDSKDPKIIGKILVAIMSDLRSVIQRAVGLRDALILISARKADGNQPLAILLAKLNAEIGALGDTVLGLPDTLKAKPVLIDLERRLRGLMGPVQ